MSERPNLIERLENLLLMLGEAQDAVTESRTENGDADPHLYEASMRIEDAGGVAGEILTMIDGR
jgi:hypothetical protein